MKMLRKTLRSLTSKVAIKKQREFMPPAYRFIAYFFQTLAWIPWERGIRTAYDLRITGYENLHKAAELKKKYNAGVLFAAKHTGELDITLVLTGIKPFTALFPMFYLTQHIKYYKSDDFGWRKYAYSRWLFYMFGAHPMIGPYGTYNELKHEDAYKTALRMHKKILEKGNSLCVFPEGYIPEDPQTVSEPHGGVGYLATAGAIVVPIAIKREYGGKKPVIKLHYGDPLTPDKHIKKYIEESKNAPDIHKELSQKITNHIKEHLDRL